MSKTETAESIEGKINKMEVVGEPERLKKIEKRIMDEAEEKAREITKEAEKARKQILEDKRKEGEIEADKITRSGTEEADSLKRQKAAEARLKAKQIIIAAREDLINEAILKTKEKLHGLTSSREYIDVLGKLIEEGAEGLGGGELEVVVAGKGTKVSVDLASIAKRVEKSTGKSTAIKLAQGASSSIGGAIVRKADGSIMIDNTFEGRIERIIRNIRIRVAKVLFE
ncbi:MAG: V-type ATP synthase subunit E family protein [Candidatus Atabeyarchaeum deiterrae]|jgi:vacuolar-type H+-ATPase subunit E/Vma4